MPVVRVKVYDTQNGEWEFDKDVKADTFADIEEQINANPAAVYTDRSTRANAFSSTNKNSSVTKDVILFKSASKSKAG